MKFKFNLGHIDVLRMLLAHGANPIIRVSLFQINKNSEGEVGKTHSIRAAIFLVAKLLYNSLCPSVRP